MSGDGGFTMLMGDLLSLRQLKLPVKVVVFNNGLLGFVDMEMKAAGFLNVGTDLENPDFAAVARAAGIKGIRVEDPKDIKGALKEAFAHKGPELVMPPKIETEHALGFSLYAAKAILNGRGTELVELARTNLFR
jgi:pyruvate dehydrogenase (quinone)